MPVSLSLLSATVNAPIPTNALAPIVADANLSFFEFISGNSISVYLRRCHYGAAVVIVDGGVVIGGTATDVSGTSVAAVSVALSPVVISDVVTGPGGGGSGWAAPMSLNASPSAPMAITAQAPTPADANLNCLDFTSDHSISVSGRTVQEGHQRLLRPIG
ncbi:MAG TPA: hypothetical protein VF328_21325 [Mycobacterium sp.]